MRPAGLMFVTFLVSGCGPSGPDPRVIPPGTGWQCATEQAHVQRSAVMAGYCERATSGSPTMMPASCPRVVAPADPGTCIFEAGAWCFTNTYNSSVILTCVTSQPQCNDLQTLTPASMNPSDCALEP